MGLGVVCIVRTVDRAPTFVAVSCVLASLWSELTEFKPVISVALCIFWSYDLDSSTGVRGLGISPRSSGTASCQRQDSGTWMWEGQNFQ